MAELNINCPACAGMLKIQAEWCGKQVKCPLCQQIITVPEENAPVEPQEQEEITEAPEELKNTEDQEEPDGKEEQLDAGCSVGLLIAIAVLHLILMYFFSSWPRTLFWLFAPWPALLGLILIAVFKNTAAKLSGFAIFIYLLLFGWWSHNAGLNKALQAEKLFEEEKITCHSAGITQVQRLLQKYAGQKNIFLTEEWSFKPSDLNTGTRVNSKCIYVVNPAYLGKELKTIPLDEVLLSCSEHSKHIIRASALAAVFNTNKN